MALIHWIITTFYTFIIVTSIIRVLMDHRPPAKTMAWVMVLLFLPIIGLLFYIFFGQDTRKERTISKRVMNELTQRSITNNNANDIVINKEYKEFTQLFSATNLAPAYTYENVEIYTKGMDFISSLSDELLKAKHFIHLITYIIDDDTIGNKIANILIQKANEGVEVRLIYDDVGCWGVKNSFFQRMIKAGVQVESFMPVRFPAFTSKVNYRNHRKICVIDENIGFIGGMNIAERYVTGTKYGDWRDTHIKIKGDVVLGLQRAFLIDWYFIRHEIIKTNLHLNNIRNDDINNLSQIVTSNPISPWKDIMQGYMRILLSAKQYVYIQTPYFLPTEPILYALKTACLSGVDVRIMIPAKSDSHIIDWASRSYVEEVLRSGVKIYYYTTGFIHSKVIISDDILCSCGSTNIDFRSFENNFECNIFIYNKAITTKLKNIFLNDERNCIVIDDVNIFTHRPFHQRLWEAVIRLLSPLL